MPVIRTLQPKYFKKDTLHDFHLSLLRFHVLEFFDVDIYHWNLKFCGRWKLNHFCLYSVWRDSSGACEKSLGKWDREGSSLQQPSKPVLRIYDILVWIRFRIRIRGSMPITNGSGFGTGSFYFHHWPTKNSFKKKIFCILLFEDTITLVFKDVTKKKSLNSRIQGFSYYFCLMIERSGSGSISE